MPQGTVTKGIKEKVPCPWCGFALNFNDVPIFEQGAMCSCDRCKQMCRIERTQTVTVVYLRAVTKQVRGLQKT